jgi:hypothetical protein
VTAHLLKFPKLPIVVVADDGDGCWVVRCGSHSWLHTNFWDAFVDARSVAEGFGVAWVIISPTNQHQQEEE